MAEPIKISELTNVGVPENSGLLPIVQNNDGTPMTWQVSLAQIADFIVKDVVFADLPTENKTIFGAILELNDKLTPEGGA